MTKQDMPQVIGVRHVGLSARDPAALAKFYRELLGLQVVPKDTAALGASRRTVPGRRVQWNCGRGIGWLTSPTIENQR